MSFRLMSNDFIADEDAKAICKLSELSSLPVSGSRLCSVSRLMLGTDVHQPAISPVHPTLTCLHNLQNLHSQGTGSEDPCIGANTHAEARLDVSFTNWVMRPREMKNSCRSCTGTHLQLFKSHSSGGTVVLPATVMHYQIKGLLSSPASVTFLH